MGGSGAEPCLTWMGMGQERGHNVRFSLEVRKGPEDWTLFVSGPYQQPLICFCPPTPHWLSRPVPRGDSGSLSHRKCPTLTLELPNPAASGKSPSLSQPLFLIYRMGISIATFQD